MDFIETTGPHGRRWSYCCRFGSLDSVRDFFVLFQSLICFFSDIIEKGRSGSHCWPTKLNPSNFHGGSLEKNLRYPYSHLIYESMTVTREDRRRGSFPLDLRRLLPLWRRRLDRNIRGGGNIGRRWGVEEKNKTINIILN